MKVSVEFSASELKEIRRLTGNLRAAAVIQRIVRQTLMLKRRAEIAAKFISGEWGVQLDGFEEARVADRKARRLRNTKWRSLR